mgnify:CR=1 FL=1
MRLHYAHFTCKDTQVNADPCVVFSAVELSTKDFNHFRNHLLERYDFLAESNEKMPVPTGSERQCVMVLHDGRDEGILVDTQGADYARYTAYLPNARAIMQQERYPSLAEFNRQMVEMADDFTHRALMCQQDGEIIIPIDEVNKSARKMDMDGFVEPLFVEMLSDREEADYVEIGDEEILYHVAPEYIVHENEDCYRPITQEDADIMCAKHFLWLHDAGGEQADFSHCLLKGIDLQKKELNGAIFDDAKLVNVCLYEAEVCGSSFAGASFYGCECVRMDAEECDFVNAQILSSNLDSVAFTHSNFRDAVFSSNRMDYTSFQNCCLQGTDFIGDAPVPYQTRGCSMDEQKWVGLAENSAQETTL